MAIPPRSLTEAEFKAALQRMFEVMFTHLIRQNAPSFISLDPDLDGEDDKPMCAYRGGFGCKCAIGWLIDDDEYDPAMEGHSASHQAVTEAVQRSQGLRQVEEEQLDRLEDFLGTAQRLLHDEPAKWIGDFRSGVRDGAQTLADIYGLTMPPLQP